MKRRPTTLIIGAGIGGLAAAVALACRGVGVTVWETEAGPGGKIRGPAQSGLDLDTGPTVMTMPSVFDELLARAGTTLDSCITMAPLEVLAHHRWRDGSTLDLHADREQTTAAIREFAGASEAARYRDFCHVSARVHDALLPAFIRAPGGGLFRMLRRMDARGLSALSGIGPVSTLWRALGRHFRDPRLRQLFGRYATYYGTSPFSAPATLMLIAHVEQSGVWRIDGGMRSLARALGDIATGLGVHIHYNSTVREILTTDNGATGVRLASGERLDATRIIVNADTNALAGGFLGTGVRHAVHATPPAHRSLSAMTWAGRVKVKAQRLDYHNVFFSDDYRREFAQITRDGRLPAEPTVYVCAPDRPLGKPHAAIDERLFVLINAPPNGDVHHYSRGDRQAATAAVTAQLATCGIDTGPSGLDGFELTTPNDFAVRYPGTGGALYGRAADGWYAAFRRPQCRTRIRGLYVAGGSTHPGAGVPMAALSGMRAADCVLDDCGIGRDATAGAA